MKNNNYLFFTLEESLLNGLKKEIENNKLLKPFFTSSTASTNLKLVIDCLNLSNLDLTDDAHEIISLLHEINSLLNFVDQNSSKECFYTRHLNETKDSFYSLLGVKSYKMIAEISRIRRISDKGIELLKATNQLSHL
tara:strand:+ start:169 stop:579 length:411 start_codon:yes stop_codon:yes gene_type:complete